jgi:hypothetical protein
MARWSLLTQYLATRADIVTLTWAEFVRVVGGVPNSAIDHYPQWWHGERSHVAAWRAAGYEATDIRPGVSVRFVRTTAARESVLQSRPREPHPVAMWPANGSAMPPSELAALNPDRCLVVIPCSARKRRGGLPVDGPAASDALAAARDRVLGKLETRADLSVLMPAWQRYDGSLYRAAGTVLRVLVAADRLVIISGGYGVVGGADPIGYYDRLMRPGDWPAGLLQTELAARASTSGLDVVAFAGRSSNYAAVLRRTRWQLSTGRRAVLVTMRDMRGVTKVSHALGRALVAFVAQTGEYPLETIVEELAA